MSNREDVRSLLSAARFELIVGDRPVTIAELRTSMLVLIEAMEMLIEEDHAPDDE